MSRKKQLKNREEKEIIHKYAHVFRGMYLFKCGKKDIYIEKESVAKNLIEIQRRE